MKKILRVFAFLSIPVVGYAQCPTDLLTGQNLVTNGDFSSGYSSWTYTPDSDGNVGTGPDGYIIFNPPVTQNYSQPGFIYAGANPNFFNSAFANFNDHSSSADNTMLMVDGVCSSGIKLWSQSGIPISANTNYYFSVWVHSLKDGNNPPGTLQFDINGTNLATTITAPTDLATGWIQYETVWNSGATPPATVTINIENTTTTGCDQYVDFAIDDIAFIPGCSYGASGPQPDLGADQTLCGKGGSITLNSNVAHNSTTTVTWSTGASGTGLGAPYTINVSTPGTYSVCVSDNGSCTKSDLIVVTNNYSIDLGTDKNLCSPTSYILDAGFTGTGVTYQWYKNPPTVAPAPSTNQTYFVNSPGTYRVVVTDPACGSRQDDIVISSTAPVPADQYFCNPGNVTLSVSPVNSGKYKWWNDPTSTALANRLQVGGNTYTFYATGTSDYTFYAEDTSSYTANVGPPASGNGFSSSGGRAVQSETELIFDVTTAFTLDYLTIEALSWSCPDNRTFQITIYNSGGGTVGVANISTTLCGSGGNIVQARVPIGISIPVGTNYKMKLTNGSNFVWYQNGAVYPMTYTPMTITGNATTGWANNAIPAFLKWEITVGTGCTRVPVKAIYNCTQPVELLSFKALKSGSDVLLQWSTATEINSSYFVIERSDDGKNFYPLGKVNASGNSSSILNYAFYDTNPLDGTSYYRLTEYDIDASYFYSKVETIQSKGTGIIVSPNPANNQFTITFATEEGESISGQLFNSLGELIIQKYFTGSSDGKVSEAINIEGIASGVYYLKISGTSQRETVKIIKE